MHFLKQKTYEEESPCVGLAPSLGKVLRTKTSVMFIFNDKRKNVFENPS
jgi:hypothetical protein